MFVRPPAVTSHPGRRNPPVSPVHESLKSGWEDGTEDDEASVDDVEIRIIRTRSVLLPSPSSNREIILYYRKSLRGGPSKDKCITTSLNTVTCDIDVLSNPFNSQIHPCLTTRSLLTLSLPSSYLDPSSSSLTGSTVNLFRCPTRPVVDTCKGHETQTTKSSNCGSPLTSP